MNLSDDGDKDSKCEGAGVEVCKQCARNSKEASVIGAWGPEVEEDKCEK